MVYLFSEGTEDPPPYEEPRSSRSEVVIEPQSSVREVVLEPQSSLSEVVIEPLSSRREVVIEPHSSRREVFIEPQSSRSEVVIEPHSSRSKVVIEPQSSRSEVVIEPQSYRREFAQSSTIEVTIKAALVEGAARGEEEQLCGVEPSGEPELEVVEECLEKEPELRGVGGGEEVPELILEVHRVRGTPTTLTDLR